MAPIRALGAVSTTVLASSLLAGLAVGGPVGAAPAPAVKTLVIGVDGASYDFLAAADMPNLDALIARSMVATSNLQAQPMAGTVSGPSWSTIATGVWPDKHRVTDNNFSSPNYGEYPDYLTRVEAAKPERSTAAVGTWGPIVTTIFGPAVDSRVAGGSDAGTTQRAVAAIAGGADDVFVHLDEVDGAGHSVGTNGAAYRTALARADRQIGDILAAVDARPDGEEWLIAVTADHGHTPTGGHGGNSLAERKVFVIASGPGITPGVRHDVKISDIAPTVLSAIGITPDPAWRLDGAAVGSLRPDAFDSLRPQLRTRLDETGIPANLLGWTHATPEGWSIDNSRMPSGGVSEWAGWSFATDEFWTQAERNQNRETNVRARDVFAVADSDEWDDRAHGAGQFDSTLVSPAYPLTGAATGTLTYATRYAIDGPQSAEVSVSFDGGPAQVLKTYTTAANTVERLAFEVPQGAATAQFRFRYTGTNSAFWTVDQVAVEQAAAPADTTRPGVTLAAPTAAGPFPSLTVKVDATDETGLRRIVANIYKDGTLVKSTQTAANGAKSASHTATVQLPDGSYTVKYNAQDLAGNISQTGTAPFTIDATAPTVTVKDGAAYTVGDGTAYDLVSFKLYDAGKIDKVVLNGTTKDLTDNAWSDVNFVKPGVFGAVQGVNTLVVHDVAGNTRTITFTLN
ncbi:alkaline phosphatase family protein [Actinocorallia sp. A-T 12471]|uniref:alkaline phosphatase family protein n=1 Tax=Actinocorallia sp. A-T 12471 TaxID=3089813 RepID=UPI0029CDA5ED|nr:alkaline phosphatase family protein [Actinocorallia sp. A-T 12471]MDX6740534.1 alkaline phosphatase family protein [Actinocorallia sp. A-T 12471]